MERECLAAQPSASLLRDVGCYAGMTTLSTFGRGRCAAANLDLDRLVSKH